MKCYRRTPAVELGLDLPPTPEAHIGAAVEETRERAIGVEAIDETRASTVVAPDVKRTDLIALRWSAFNAMLLPVNQHCLSDVVPRQLGVEADVRGRGSLTSPERGIPPVELVHGAASVDRSDPSRRTYPDRRTRKCTVEVNQAPETIEEV